MKYLILVTTLIATSPCSVVAMNRTYQEMLERINNSAAGKPSITLVNKSEISLWFAIGDLEKDGIRSHMPLHKNAEFTFSPYTEPFCLKEEYLKMGARIDLYTARPEEENSQHKSLLIGGISEVKFGDTVLINCNNNKLNFKRSSADRPERPSKRLVTIKRNSTK
jgi:hypothetical protein